MNKFEISWISLWRISLFALILAGIYLIRDVLTILTLAIIISLALSPMVDFLAGKKIPRLLSCILIFGIFLAVFIALSSFFLPKIIPQIGDFFLIFRENTIHLVNFLFIEEIAEQIIFGVEDAFNQFLKSTQRLIGLVFSLFGRFFYLLTGIVLSFYLTLRKKGIEGLFQFFLPEAKKEGFLLVFSKIKRRVNLWFKGQIFLCLSIGLATWLGLYLLGVRHALILALLAGVLEIVPIFGPLLAGIVAFLVASGDSFLQGIWVVLLFIIIQQVENNLLVPLIMKKALKIEPVLIILALLIGISLAGFIGFVLAIPILAIAQELFKETKFFKEK